MSKMINIDDLHREHDKKDEMRINIYNNILEKVHQKIKFTSKTSNDKFCFFSVPIYVYGLPLFDVNNCIIFLTKKLTDNGFDIRYTHPNLLLISWLVKPKKQPTIMSGISNLAATNRIEEIKRRALEYQPKNNLIYDNTSSNSHNSNNSLNSLHEKANQLLFN